MPAASSPQSASNDDDPAFTDADLGLRDTELFWYNHYTFLEKHGYRLRNRYKPGVLSKWITDWRAGVGLRGPWHEIEAITTRTVRAKLGRAALFTHRSPRPIPTRQYLA